MTTQPTPIRSQPGIQRDGTVFASTRYVDGEWCRFQRNLPRKIGGYRRISNDVTGIVRQFHTQAQGGVVYTHVGHANGVQRFTIDTSGNTSAPDDRSPVGFVSDADYNWTFDAMRNSTGSGETLLFAHPARSTLDISSAAEFPVYYGDIYSTTPLVNAGFSVSGGCVVLHPYLFGYGNNGVVSWSDAGDPLNRSSGDAGDATIDAAKIIKGLPVRGGGQSPAGLFWSLTSLIRASYVGSSAIFAFDTVTSTTSVLAANGIIEYDGVFFWCGLDRFSLYNGVVRDLPNDVNSNFFFDNLNYACANKIFAFKVPRFGEIWWCFPKGTATECNHAIVYNVRENSWYDTPLPEGGRSAGIYAQVFRSPLLAGVTVVDLAPGETRITEADVIRETEDDEERITDTGFTSYKIWRHEIGTDAIDGVSVAAIRSFFETGNISLLTSEEPKTNALRIAMLEPDFVQTGDMSVTVVGSINAKAPVVDGEQKSFPAVAATGADEVVKFKEQRRILRLRFESNAVGGDYQMGNPIAHLEPVDERFQS
jgi:hypothetical protein